MVRPSQNLNSGQSDARVHIIEFFNATTHASASNDTNAVGLWEVCCYITNMSPISFNLFLPRIVTSLDYNLLKGKTLIPIFLNFDAPPSAILSPWKNILSQNHRILELEKTLEIISSLTETSLV